MATASWHTVFGATVIGIWALMICVGGLAVLGVVHLIKEAPKDHPLNRKQGIGVMLFGTAFLIWQLTDRFSPGWVAIASIPVGLFLVAGALWILSEVRQGVHKFQQQRESEQKTTSR